MLNAHLIAAKQHATVSENWSFRRQVWPDTSSLPSYSYRAYPDIPGECSFPKARWLRICDTDTHYDSWIHDLLSEPRGRPFGLTSDRFSGIRNTTSRSIVCADEDVVWLQCEIISRGGRLERSDKGGFP